MIKNLCQLLTSCCHCEIDEDDISSKNHVLGLTNEMEIGKVLVKDVEDEPVVNLVEMKGEVLLDVEDVVKKAEEVDIVGEAECVQCLVLIKEQENFVSELNNLKQVLEEQNLEIAKLKKEKNREIQQLKEKDREIQHLEEQLQKANYDKVEIQMHDSRILNSENLPHLEVCKMKEYVDYQRDEAALCRRKEYRPTLNHYKELFRERKPEHDNIKKAWKNYIEVEEEYQQHIIKYNEFKIRIHSEAKANNECLGLMLDQLVNIKIRIKQSISMLDHVIAPKLKPKIGFGFKSLSGDSCQPLGHSGMSPTAMHIGDYSLRYDRSSKKSRGVDSNMSNRVISDITIASLNGESTLSSPEHASLSSERLLPQTIRNEQLLMTKSLSETIIKEIGISKESSIDSDFIESQRNHQIPANRIQLHSSEKLPSKQYMDASKQKDKFSYKKQILSSTTGNQNRTMDNSDHSKASKYFKKFILSWKSSKRNP